MYDSKLESKKALCCIQPTLGLISGLACPWHTSAQSCFQDESALYRQQSEPGTAITSVLHHTYVSQTRCRQHLHGILRGFSAGLISGDGADSQQLNAGVVACMHVSPKHCRWRYTRLCPPHLVICSCTRLPPAKMSAMASS